MTHFTHELVVCEECGEVHRWRPLASDEVARCGRCAAVVGRGHRLGASALLALTLAAAVVLSIAVLTPVAQIRLQGNWVSATLPEAVGITWNQDERLVAVCAAFTAMVAPALLIGLRLVVLWPLAQRHAMPYFGWAMRTLHAVSRWSMVEVLMVAGAIAIVRIASLAHAAPGPGMIAFGALALLLAALESGGLRHLWWECS